jgi:hypothetical protein
MLLWILLLYLTKNHEYRVKISQTYNLKGGEVCLGEGPPPRKRRP